MQIVYNGLPKFLGRFLYAFYTHCWELMNSVGSHGSSSLPFMMKVMVCHFVSDTHEVMTALIVMLPLIVVVEISLQLHPAVFPVSKYASMSYLVALHEVITGDVFSVYKCVLMSHLVALH